MSRRVSFVLPAMNRTGGVRTALEMANRLADRGWSVRVCVRRPRGWSGLRDRLQRLGAANRDWSDISRVPLEPYVDFRRVALEAGEIVIGVGSYTVDDLQALGEAPVRRVLWCKGLTQNMPRLMQRAWGSPLPRIVVSPTLVDMLEPYGGGRVIGVVPNGISTQDYHELPGVERDGIGLIFSTNWKKDPEFTEALVARLEADLPERPLRVFGVERAPRTLRRGEFHQSPSVAEACRLYNRSLVWLITSRSEGFCNPILEAMACGAAVVSTAHDTAPGLIDDGRNGLLVPLGDLGGFVARVRDLLDDDAAREALRRAGRATAAGYTWEAAVSKMEAVLEGPELGPLHG